MRARIERLAALAATALLLAGCESGGSPRVETTPAPWPHEGFFFKGVNFTAEWPVQYQDDGAVEMLGRLPDYGVNAIALVPYGGGRLGDPDFRYPGRWESDEGVRRLAAEAHTLGLKVLLKPQLWFRGGYPGDLEFDSDAERERFFRNYRGYVEHYAELATEIEADVLSVGVEFAKLTRYEAEWRELIALARSHYAGPLTYAANFGEEFESIAFWDALDYIGLDNYYPLGRELSIEDAAGRIEAVHRRFNRPVLFTEAGFAIYEETAERPWEDQPGGEMSLEAQAECYEAFLAGYYDKPWLAGIFWWKVGTANEPRRPGRGTHIPWARPAMDVVKRWYGRDPKS